MKVLFIGGGNMAQAIGHGLIARGTPASDIGVIEPVEALREDWRRRGARADAGFTPEQLAADTLVLAVKPQAMEAALAPFAGRLAGQLVLSIAAGIRAARIGRWLGGSGEPYAHIVRCMPNTPAMIGAGITGVVACPGVSATQRQVAEDLLGTVGKVRWFDDEAMLDAVTAVSGSGPAYVFYFIEALEEAALALGFEPTAARQFAVETFAGSAQLAARSADSPSQLRAKVTSRRGTTERAIECFDAAGLKSAFIAGVVAARERARELGDEADRAEKTDAGSTRPAGGSG